MIVFVDIDETICEYQGERRYPEALPVKKNIEKINRLYDKGHTIVYWTARGSTTGLDWYDLTETQLSVWGVKYHDLRIGKPHYDIFICDKAINTERFFNDNDRSLLQNML